jgi:hypothetical protein
MTMNCRHTWFLIVGTAFFCATPVAHAAIPFDETLNLLGISFHVIAFPALEDDPENAKGYRGHDEFAVLEGVVGRRFPIYPDDKIRPEPTGKMRQIQYKLVPGEASWMLKIDRVAEF